MMLRSRYEQPKGGGSGGGDGVVDPIGAAASFSLGDLSFEF